MKAHTTLNFDMFNRHCLLIVGDEAYAREVVTKTLEGSEKYTIDDFDLSISTTGGKCIGLECGDTVIVIGIPDPSLLVHELMHAVFHVLDVSGLKLCAETNEVYAYLIAHLHKQAYEWMLAEARHHAK